MDSSEPGDYGDHSPIMYDKYKNEKADATSTRNGEVETLILIDASAVHTHGEGAKGHFQQEREK